MSILSISVIIPTYNRASPLRRLLEALAQQTYPSEKWEVIVVDDGSTDSTSEEVAARKYPFRLRCFGQSNLGAVAARNLGARQSSADVLVFLDDDVVVEPRYIACLANEHERYDRAVIMGTFKPYITAQNPPFRAICANNELADVGLGDWGTASFTECVSHNLSIRLEHFLAIGMFQDPSHGQWPNWDDIDLAYRAYQAGFSFRRLPEAVGCHIDYALDDLSTNCQRTYRAGKSAVSLFHKYPGLQRHLPMFRDKTPISVRDDSPRLVARKLLRGFLGWAPVLWCMERLTHIIVERIAPRPALLRPLYRWITSSYIYRGYRQGLREHGPVEEPR